MPMPDFTKMTPEEEAAMVPAWIRVVSDKRWENLEGESVLVLTDKFINVGRPEARGPVIGLAMDKHDDWVFPVLFFFKAKGRLPSFIPVR